MTPSKYTVSVRRFIESGLAPALLAAALAALLLAACGGGSSSTPAAAPPTAEAPRQAGLETAQPGELVAYFKTRIERRVARGLTGTETVVAAPVDFTPAPGATASPPGGAPLQEAGVDEDNLLKTDGRALHALVPPRAGSAAPPQLLTYLPSGDGSLAAPVTTTLPAGLTPNGMFITPQGDRLVVLGERFESGPPGAPSILIYPPWPRRTQLDIYAAPQAAPAALQRRLVLDGQVVGSRMIGSVLYLATTWTPDLSRYSVPAGSTPVQVQAALAALRPQDLLPTVRIDDGPAQPLVAESECYLQPANASLDLRLTVLTAIDLGQPALPRASRCFAGGVNALYMSPAHVWLASSQDHSIDPRIALPAQPFPADSSTDIHKFALSGMQIDYRGSGRVAGHLGWDREKMPYRMGEHQGLLRVLTYTGQTGWAGPAGSTQAGGASPATLTVLREDTANRRLVTVSTLPNARRPAPLGLPGEQVYAVRFAGERGYLVTFRQTDPLYVLDLSDPADPKVAGELTLPGFSDYLFPLSGGKLLGVGKAATTTGERQGIKIALFDVSRPAAPAVLATRELGQRGSTSALDATRHGLSLLESGNRVRIALPVRVVEALGVTGLATGYQGLARFEVDTAAGTLVQRPTAIATRFDGTAGDTARYVQYELAHERSLLVPGGAYYLSGGQLSWVREP